MHQYDFDTETVISFLKEHKRDKDFKVKIEVNHATFAGHLFEISLAFDNRMLGSNNVNIWYYQNGSTVLFPLRELELTQCN